MAMKSACREPSSAKTCAQIFAACYQKGKAPTFSKEECLSAFDAITPERAKQEIFCASEGCSLKYCLPYQPFWL